MLAGGKHERKPAWIPPVQNGPGPGSPDPRGRMGTRPASGPFWDRRYPSSFRSCFPPARHCRVLIVDADQPAVAGLEPILQRSCHDERRDGIDRRIFGERMMKIFDASGSVGERRGIAHRT